MLEEFVSFKYLQSHYEEDVHVGIKYKPNLKDSDKYLDLLSKTRAETFPLTTRVPTKTIWRCIGVGLKLE